MPGKARVHELAKEFGVDSKTVLAKLKEQGEFVKSASSTVEAPVARRIREAFASAGNGGGSDSGTAAPKAAVPRRFVPAGVPAGKGRAMEKPRTGVLAAEPSPPATPPTLLSRLSVRPLQGLSKVSEHADGRPPPKGGRPSTDVLRSGVT